MFPSDEELISAYLDDELSNEERARAEQLLTERADLRRLLDELKSLREGLQSLPAYALGEDFGSLVLRRAEREVLQSDGAAIRGIAAAPAPPDAAATPREPSTPPTPASLTAPPPPSGDEPHEPRWRRPAAWAIVVTAAALLLTLSERGWFGPQRDDVAQAPQNAAPTAAKPGEEAPANRPVPQAQPKEGESYAMKGDAEVAAGDKQNLLARGTATPTAEAPFSKAGPTVGGSPPGNDSGAAADGLEAQAAVVAQNDLNRALTIAANWRQLQHETAQQRVSAVQLQQRLAEVETFNRRSAGSFEPGSQGYGSFGGATQLAQTAGGAAAGQAGAIVADEKRQSSGAMAKGAATNAQEQLAVQSPAAGDAGRAMQTDQRRPAEPAIAAVQTFSEAQLGKNLLVVTCDITPDAIAKVVTPALRQAQIADFNNSWQVDGSALAAAQSYGNVMRQADPQLPAAVSNTVGVSAPEAAGLAAPRGDVAVRTEPSGKKADGAVKDRNLKESGAEGGVGAPPQEEFFYICASEKELQATLATLRDRSDYVLNLHVEPAPTTPVDESRWTAYNRGIVIDGKLAEARRRKEGDAASSPQLGVPVKAITGATVQIAPGAAAAPPAPSAAAPAAISAPLSLLNDATGLPANEGVFGQSAATNAMPAASGDNGFNFFAGSTAQTPPLGGIAVQEQSGARPYVPQSRAQRLTSQQVAELQAVAAGRGVAVQAPTREEAKQRESSIRSNAADSPTAPAAQSAAPAAIEPSAAPAPPKPAEASSSYAAGPEVRQQSQQLSSTARKAAAALPPGEPLVVSSQQSSPPLPPDYREAIFVFRVVDPTSSEAETLSEPIAADKHDPIAADRLDASPKAKGEMNVKAALPATAPADAKPAPAASPSAPAPPVKKAG